MFNETLHRLNEQIRTNQNQLRALRQLGEHQAADDLDTWLKVQKAARDRLREDAKFWRQKNFQRARRSGRRSTKA